MPKSGATSRPLRYPTIEDGNLAFPQGEYDASFLISGENEGILKHKLEGAPFIQRLINQGKAEFACLVFAPSMGYRELQRTETKNPRQKIHWHLEIVGKEQFPMLGPVILYVGDDSNYKLTEEDGVAPSWQNKEIYIPRGARLAKGRYLRQSTTILKLLSFNPDENMKPGSFTVTERTRGSRFYFSLDAHPDIFKLLQLEGNKLRDSIITHAISGCFNLLLKDTYRSSNEDDEERWRQYPDLVALSDYLIKQTGKDWNDPKFDPIKAATEIRPMLNL